MNKGFYLTFNLKQFLILTLTSVLAFSVVLSIHYSSLASIAANSTAAQPTIIVDPGHGGMDGGTQSSSGILEKDINLSISLKIGELLRLMGYKVVYTRDEDEMLHNSEGTIRQNKVSDIHNRMEIIEKNPGCVFLSIHQNYYEQSKYSGAQVFYSKNNPDSKILAENIQSSVVSKLQNDNTRQVKQSGTEIYLLYHTDVPAVMVECGFLSNGGEALLLSDNDYQSKMALAIIDGLLQYLSDDTRI